MHYIHFILHLLKISLLNNYVQSRFGMKIFFSQNFKHWVIGTALCCWKHDLLKITNTLKTNPKVMHVNVVNTRKQC